MRRRVDYTGWGIDFEREKPQAQRMLRSAEDSKPGIPEVYALKKCLGKLGKLGSSESGALAILTRKR
jgi:hypothetical protein